MECTRRQRIRGVSTTPEMFAAKSTHERGSQLHDHLALVPVRLVVRNFGELRRTCLLDARNTDSLRFQNSRESMESTVNGRVCRPQLAGVELGKTGECNGAIHLISLKDARRVNGTIALSSTAP